MKYKVGDTVKIKEGLKEGYTPGLIEEMEKYCGKIAKIVDMDSNSYKLDIDYRCWYWNDNMLESSKSKKYEIIVEGNTVTVTDDKGNTGIAKCSPEDEFNLSTGISIAIDRLKWKPKRDENYWTVNFSYKLNVLEYTWCNDSCDKEFYKKGLVFKTKEEAEKVAKIMLDSFKGVYN